MKQSRISNMYNIEGHWKHLYGPFNHIKTKSKQAISINMDFDKNCLAGNMFLNQALLALTELPSVFIGQYIIDR